MSDYLYLLRLDTTSILFMIGITIAWGIGYWSTQKTRKTAIINRTTKAFRDELKTTLLESVGYACCAFMLRSYVDVTGNIQQLYLDKLDPQGKKLTPFDVCYYNCSAIAPSSKGNIKVLPFDLRIIGSVTKDVILVDRIALRGTHVNDFTTIYRNGKNVTEITNEVVYLCSTFLLFLSVQSMGLAKFGDVKVYNNNTDEAMKECIS